jgi:polyisoprenoid-binding protein YceI
MEITMTRTQLLTLAATLAALGAPLAAQDTKMSLRPESKVTLAGSSNVHDWACTSLSFSASIELDENYATKPLSLVAKPISKVSVEIPVRSLKCGHGKMDDNMYKALKANEFPVIKYVLGSYEVKTNETTAEKFVAITTGEITVAGKTITTEIPITAVRKDGGSMVGEGAAKLLMTDFGIKPPVAMLGTLRTKNEIEVKFNVLLDKATVVALTQK